MKKFCFILFSISILIGFGCQEIAPVLNPGGGGTTTGGGDVENQMKQVLIEEFTGVRCVNCPAGSEAIEALLAIHGEQLVAVSIHAGFFAQPDPEESQEDLSTPKGNAILSLLGSPIGYPTAVINRHQFPGEENLQVGQGTWAGYIGQELAAQPSVKIDLQTSFDEVTRKLTVNTDLYVQEVIDDSDVRLTLYLIENNVIDWQITPGGEEADYVHKHVFRDALTTTEGDIINEAFVPNAVIERELTYTVPTGYNVENCHVVGFVHLGGSSKDVLQAHEVSILD